MREKILLWYRGLAGNSDSDLSLIAGGPVHNSGNGSWDNIVISYFCMCRYTISAKVAWSSVSDLGKGQKCIHIDSHW